MIWLTSDLHGGQDTEGFEKYVSVCGEDDWLFILGDLELNFRDTEENRSFSDYFMSLKCNIAFLDGNHENFDYLYSLPEEDWEGGRVHRVSENIVHLMRGYIFELEGSSFLVMGGCVSSQKWKTMGLWWSQEDPTAEEIERAYKNLAERGNKVDYVLTHKYRKNGIPVEGADPFSLDGFINYVEDNVEYKHWYSGHWHKTKEVDSKHTVVFSELMHI